MVVPAAAPATEVTVVRAVMLLPMPKTQAAGLRPVPEVVLAVTARTVSPETVVMLKQEL